MTALPGPRRIENAAATAEIFDHGAHLTSWVPAGGREVLFLSAAAVLDSTSAIRGGVPICFPWFGPGISGTQVPAHGFARLSPWRLASREDDGDRSVLTYVLEPGDVSAIPQPSAFRATYRIEIGHVLDLELTVENTGAEDVTYEEALHAYLAVGDVERIRIDGLSGAAYRDKAAGGVERRQSGPVVFGGEVDRVYRSADEVTVVDPVLDRRIVVTRRNSRDLVVWNPGSLRAEAIADLGAGQWREFACVEGANVLDAAITLAPGQRHAMGYRLHLS